MSSHQTEVLRTPWFSVLSRPMPSGDPYYLLDLPDYVSVLAVTPDDRVVLVRQFRPAVDRVTIEFPSGHVEPGEQPVETARRELREETGYEAGDLEYLGSMQTDVGRLNNRLWCYFARAVRPGAKAATVEDGIDVIEVPRTDLLKVMLDGGHALDAAVLMLACARGRLSVG